MAMAADAGRVAGLVTITPLAAQATTTLRVDDPGKTIPLEVDRGKRIPLEDDQANILAVDDQARAIPLAVGRARVTPLDAITEIQDSN
jgi:hypothetical protein